jgi:hypothetical protein
MALDRASALLAVGEAALAVTRLGTAVSGRLGLRLIARGNENRRERGDGESKQRSSDQSPNHEFPRGLSYAAEMNQFASNCQGKARFCRELGPKRPDSRGAIDSGGRFIDTKT